VKQLRTMLDGRLDGLASDLNTLLLITDDIDRTLEVADIFLAILIAISLVFLVLVLVMLVGAYLAYRGISNRITTCVRRAMIWPVFVVMLTLSWIFATLFLSASLAGADFCIDPDAYVQVLLNEHSEKFKSIFFGFVLYYVSGCAVKPPGMEDFEQLAILISSMLTYSHDLFDMLSDLSVDTIAQICGLSTESAMALKVLAEFFHKVTHILNRVFGALWDLLRCENFNSIYTTFVHQALCVEGVSGLAYIFMSALIVSIFSMIMITCRAALNPIIEPAASDSRGEEIINIFVDEERQDPPKDETDAVPLLIMGDPSHAVEDGGRTMPEEENAVT